METQDGFDFGFEPSACKTCGGSCCIGESAWVWLSEEDIARLANYLNMTASEFESSSVIYENGKKSLSEKALQDGTFACIYFDLTGMCCSVYDARPEQCRTFPFWDEYLLWQDGPILHCPGIIPNPGGK